METSRAKAWSSTKRVTFTAQHGWAGLMGMALSSSLRRTRTEAGRKACFIASRAEATGRNPNWGGLAFDTANNLYGATPGGGEYGYGTIFELSPNSDGTWTESVLHQFTGKSDGADPYTTPIFDAAGNLYATVAGGGAYGCGTAFKMTPGSNNHWTFHVIHQFKGQPACSPWVGLTRDAAGAFYGTTRDGGFYCQQGSNCGAVFKLTPTSDGGWTYKVIHEFTGGKPGADPSVGGLVFDGQGNLYGATEVGGAYGYGLVFKLAPGTGDKWTYQVLHQFKGLQDGGDSIGRMIFDAAGNLYGPAWYGGVVRIRCCVQTDAEPKRELDGKCHIQLQRE